MESVISVVLDCSISFCKMYFSLFRNIYVPCYIPLDLCLVFLSMLFTFFYVLVNYILYTDNQVFVVKAGASWIYFSLGVCEISSSI